jgi:hypothetical protein
MCDPADDVLLEAAKTDRASSRPAASDGKSSVTRPGFSTIR